MPQQQKAIRAYTEADMQLAISDLNSNQIQTEKHAAAIYNVPRATLRDRRAGRRRQRDCEPQSKRMSKLEEEVIVQSILDQSLRGFAPSKAFVRDMANKLLADRGEKPVGKTWVDTFIKRTPELKTRWSRPYDHQRAACEDPALI